MENQTFKKNFIWNMIGMTLNSFNSLFFMIIVTRINGVNMAGIFTLAFSLACLFYFIGVYSGRVYQVTDINEKNKNIDYIMLREITCLTMIIVSFVYAMIMHYKGIKFWIVVLLCIFKSLEAFSDVLYGIQQKNNELYKSGISLTVKSVLSLLLFLIIDLLTKNLIMSISVAIIFVWLFVILCYDFPQTYKYIDSKKISLNSVFSIFKNGFFIFLVNFFAVYIVNASKYTLDLYANSSQQAIFGIILMPATFISVAVQYFIQPYLQILTNLFKENKIREYNKSVFKLLFFTTIIGIACLTGAYFLGIPVLSLIYGIDLNGYLLHLELIIFGAIFYSFGIIISAALTTVRYTFNQVVVYILTILLGVIYMPILIGNYGLVGAAISYLFMMLSQFALYILIYLFLNINKKLFSKSNKT